MSKFHHIFYFRPLFYIAIVFILGILFGKIIGFSIILLLGLAGLFSIVYLASFILKKPIISYPALFLVIFLFGALAYQNSLRLPPEHIANFVVQGEKLTSVKGLIISDPVYSRTVYGTGKTSFILKAKQIRGNQLLPSGSGTRKVTREGSVKKRQWYDTQGKIRVILYNHPDLFKYGDLLEIEGRLYSPGPPTNPGQFNYKKYLQKKGIYALLTPLKKSSSTGQALNQKKTVRFISKDNGNFIMRYALKINHIVKKKLYAFLPEKNAALVSAMLLGNREDLPDELIENFKDSGSMHILAVSGLHVGIILFILLGFFKLAGIPLRANFILTLVFIIFYCLLTGARPSVVRASIMVSVFLFGKSIYREPDIYNSMGLAGLIILVYNPQQLFMAGFILSFMAVLSIVYLTPKIESKLNFNKKVYNTKWAKVVGYFIKLFSGSVAVWIGLMPVIWYFFNIISQVTIIANLIVIPLAFTVLFMSIISIIVSYISVFLAEAVFYLGDINITVFYKIVSLFSNFSLGHFYIPDIKMGYVVCFYITLILLIEHKKIRLDIKKIIILLIVLLSVIAGVKTKYVFNNYDELEVTFLDVGDGDSIFVRLPENNGNILIDTGRRIPYNSGKFIIGPFLWDKGIKTIDCLILTHPQSDHIGGAEWLINHFNVNRVIDNGSYSNTKTYAGYREAININNIIPEVIYNFRPKTEYEKVVMEILHPSKKIAQSKYISSNNKSIVLNLKYKKIDFLFCADIKYKIIKELLNTGQMGDRVEIIKIPHHGRVKKDAVISLYENLNPKTFVISCSEKTLKYIRNPKLFLNGKLKTYFTATSGAITVITDGMGFKVKGFIN